MSIEASVALLTAWIAHSPALLAFGGDSVIELLSASIVLRRFRLHPAGEQWEKRAEQFAGALLIILAAYVVLVSLLALTGRIEPRPSRLGVGILIAALLFMPWLAKEKRELSASTGSAALRADAAESALCAYFSAIALVGIGVNAIWHISWADPISALAVTPLIGWEGQRTMRGKCHGCA